MMDESNSDLIWNRTDASLALVVKGKCNAQSFQKESKKNIKGPSLFFAD